MAEHKDLTDPELHEPKGVAAASVDTCYVADGSGSGTWKASPYKYTLNLLISDVSTPGSHFVVAPVAGKITKFNTVLQGAITTADVNLSLELGGVLVTNSSLTIPFSGSVAGTVVSSTPSAANSVSAGQAIEIITDGASSGTAACVVTLEISVGYA